ncbi:MAG: putative Ig domain-containing protein, partial [Chitinimonas sp.]|nr:putative Ig domain-containing protein [Chitinimonas sp.]
MNDLVGKGAISELVFENGERYTLADFGLNALDPVIKGTAGDDQLSGESIDDKMEGYAGNDALYGNSGNDILIGDLGNDTLSGGMDRDTLIGGLGSDTYELGNWAGHDTVIESGAEGEQNVLQFAQGIRPDQIRLERVGNHLVVHYDQSKAANSVTLQDYYTSAQDSVGKGYISELVFDTGRYTLSHFGLEAVSTAIAGTDGNDVLSGFNSNDTLEGQAGNDTLVGKAGNDTLNGGLGDDTYELYSGSGHDTVIESGVAGEQNILKFGPGTDPAHLRLERVGNSLVVHYDQSKVANSVTLQDYYHGVDDKIGKGLIGAVQFDGTGETLAFSHFLSQLNQAPVVAGEVVDQLATAESLFSWQLPAGLFADADGDKLAYTVSQADGSALPDWLKFDAATGLLSGTPVNSQAGVLALRVTATDPGNLSTHLDFALQVRAINHAPEAVGALEKQTTRVGQPFEFYLPEGMFRDVDSEAGDSLTLSFTLADGSPLPVWLSFDAATRKLSGTPGAASVGELQLVVVAQDTAGASAKLGLGLTVTAPAGTVLTGGTGADNLQGTAGADSLSGMAGNDKLYGNDGNDTLRGDAGNDLLDGGEGDNLLDGGDG